jgi:hypothetical protein
MTDTIDKVGHEIRTLTGKLNFSASLSVWSVVVIVREFITILISAGFPIKSCELKRPRDDLGHFSTMVARALAWVGILAIIVLSVVPAVDRPVTGARQLFEHFSAFALVAGVLAIGYRLSLIRLLLLTFSFVAELNCFKCRCRQGMQE